jgi:hypothetical protein
MGKTRNICELIKYMTIIIIILTAVLMQLSQLFRNQEAVRLS